MVLVKKWVQACTLGPLCSRAGAVDQVSFSFVANYRRGQIQWRGAGAALLSSRLHSSSNPLWIDGPSWPSKPIVFAKKLIESFRCHQSNNFISTAPYQ